MGWAARHRRARHASPEPIAQARGRCECPHCGRVPPRKRLMVDMDANRPCDDGADAGTGAHNARPRIDDGADAGTGAHNLDDAHTDTDR